MLDFLSFDQSYKNLIFYRFEYFTSWCEKIKVAADYYAFDIFDIFT